MDDLKSTIKEEDGKIIQQYWQDINPHVEYAKYMRDDVSLSDHKKQDMWKVATIPDAVIIEMMEKHKFNIYTDKDTKRLAYLIDTEYPYLKTMNVSLSRRA